MASCDHPDYLKPRQKAARNETVPELCCAAQSDLVIALQLFARNGD
jgi:hypothetical protein